MGGGVGARRVSYPVLVDEQQSRIPCTCILIRSLLLNFVASYTEIEQYKYKYK
jgi:hypothetical protein